jgi:pyruvate dehydrogenase E2 component (dihydrolipoamide acetyltransferase)
VVKEGFSQCFLATTRLIMPTEITMPKLSDTMTEGRLISWKKSVGEKVARGEIIAEVETDKATMELEAFASGVLLEIRIKPGEMAPVGTVIGMIGAAAETAEVQSSPGQPAEEAPIPPAAPTAPTAPVAPTTPAAPTTTAPTAPTAPVAPTTPAAPTTTAPTAPTAPTTLAAPAAEAVPETEPTGPGEPPDRVSEPPVPATAAGKAPASEPEAGEKASPRVRRLAREQGIDLEQVKGSGPEGRIMQEDLVKAGTGDLGPGIGLDETGAAAGEKEAVSPGVAAQPLSRMRAAIARTVAEAWRTIPHFTVTMAIDMGEAERVRQELKDSGSPLSLNDLLVKAAAVAIGKFPLVNASFVADGISSPAGINIGIAVALADGLLVPVIRGCQSLSLQAIALQSRELVGKAHSGKLSETDISGGTFTISNLGMFGVEQFMAIILPIQGAVLAVGAVIDQPVIKGGHLAAARIMRVTLSADHRLLDGAYAAQFLAELKLVLENPVRMLV